MRQPAAARTNVRGAVQTARAARRIGTVGSADHQFGDTSRSLRRPAI